MKVELGLFSLELPEDELMAPVMFVAMGTQDKKADLAVGPTLAKAKPQAFRRTLTINVNALAKNEAPEAALKRMGSEIRNRVRGTEVVTEMQDRDGQQGLYCELTHKGQAEVPLRTYLWLRNDGPWIYLLNLTGLDDKKSGAALLKTFDGLVGSLKTSG